MKIKTHAVQTQVTVAPGHVAAHTETTDAPTEQQVAAGTPTLAHDGALTKTVGAKTGLAA